MPYYFLIRDIAGREAALPSALAFACFPILVLLHSDILTDGLFHFFFLSSLTLSWLGVSRTRWPEFLLAGAAGGLAYLTRPEGILAPVFLFGLSALALTAEQLGGKRLKWLKLPLAAASALVFLTLAFPLAERFREMRGHWVVSKPGSALQGDNNSSPEASSNGGKIAAIGAAGGGLLLLPLAAWALGKGRRRYKIVGATSLVCLAYGCLLLVPAAGTGGPRLNRQHFLLPFLFLTFCPGTVGRYHGSVCALLAPPQEDLRGLRSSDRNPSGLQPWRRPSLEA